MCWIGLDKTNARTQISNRQMHRMCLYTAIKHREINKKERAFGVDQPRHCDFGPLFSVPHMQNDRHSLHLADVARIGTKHILPLCRQHPPRVSRPDPGAPLRCPDGLDGPHPTVFSICEKFSVLCSFCISSKKYFPIYTYRAFFFS